MECLFAEWRELMLATSTYRDAFQRDAAALAAAARRGLAAPVPSCPGWTVATLLTHLTGIYAHRIKLVRVRARENVVQAYEDLDLPAEYQDWFDAQGEDLSTMPPGLLALFERTAAELEAVLWSVEPEEPVWTWWPADQTAGFWQRRMAHETAVHRWDAQLAHGDPQPIESELARDGIDEVLDVMVPMRRAWAETPRTGTGEAYHFHRTDGPGEWLVRFEPDRVVVTREHARGDVAVRGTASDLLLFLWQRIPAERLKVFGEAAVLERFFDLAPPD
jgi:uncharacterized protein (TIGR03083 family)